MMTVIRQIDEQARSGKFYVWNVRGAKFGMEIIALFAGSAGF
jgi:hypothetical protein